LDQQLVTYVEVMAPNDYAKYKRTQINIYVKGITQLIKISISQFMSISQIFRQFQVGELWKIKMSFMLKA